MAGRFDAGGEFGMVNWGASTHRRAEATGAAIDVPIVQAIVGSVH
jgi:hypothetical protein